MTDFDDVLRECKKAAFSLAIFSGLINVLSLSGSFFMLEIYDRVVPSRSVPTLIGLGLILLFLFSCQGFLDVIRSRVLLRMGISINNVLTEKIYRHIVRSTGDPNVPIRDLDSIRGFLSSMGPSALFDLPWMPLYLAIIFAFHPLLGWTAVFGGVVLVCLTVLTEIKTKASLHQTLSFSAFRQKILDSSSRNSEVLLSMGMLPTFQSFWSSVNHNFMEHHQTTSDLGGIITTISKMFRLFLQSVMLGVGAYLVINNEATGGVIIAGSILTARALAPLDLAISQWKGFAQARGAWARTKQLLSTIPTDAKELALPHARKSLTVENLSGGAPGTPPFVHNVSFQLEAGTSLGIIGTSASGKSTLARMLVGVWPITSGHVRFDGASLDQWNLEELGRNIGYLPQDVTLFEGTVAKNISRFSSNAQTKDILAAAEAADVHTMIVNFPKGYDTELGENGLRLSAGQKQRIALARALYGNPFLTVLDEPNSNLDIMGEAALSRAIDNIKARGGIVVVISHRPSVLMTLDYMLVMENGSVSQFGNRNQILNMRNNK